MEYIKYLSEKSGRVWLSRIIGDEEKLYLIDEEGIKEFHLVKGDYGLDYPSPNPDKTYHWKDLEIMNEALHKIFCGKR